MRSIKDTEALFQRVEELTNHVDQLEKEIKDLKREDENILFKSKSLCEKTGRRPGGQKGHEGTTLEMTSSPNEIIDHYPEYCECCGKDIGAISLPNR